MAMQWNYVADGQLPPQGEPLLGWWTDIQAPRLCRRWRRDYQSIGGMSMRLPAPDYWIRLPLTPGGPAVKTPTFDLQLLIRQAIDRLTRAGLKGREAKAQAADDVLHLLKRGLR